MIVELDVGLGTEELNGPVDVTSSLNLSIKLNASESHPRLVQDSISSPSDRHHGSWLGPCVLQCSACVNCQYLSHHVSPMVEVSMVGRYCR